MKKRAGFLSTLIVTTLVCLTGTAHATTVDWTASGGPSDFDTATISFTGFFADTLDSVFDTGTVGSFHSHVGNLITATLEVRVDGGWEQIWLAVTSTSTAMPPLLSNINFTLGMVDGLRLTATPQINYAFHSQKGMFYKFSDSTALPEPSSMLLLGSGLVGLFGYQMKKKAKTNSR